MPVSSQVQSFPSLVSPAKHCDWWWLLNLTNHLSPLPSTAASLDQRFQNHALSTSALNQLGFDLDFPRVPILVNTSLCASLCAGLFALHPSHRGSSLILYIHYNVGNKLVPRPIRHWKTISLLPLCDNQWVMHFHPQGIFNVLCLPLCWSVPAPHSRNNAFHDFILNHSGQIMLVSETWYYLLNSFLQYLDLIKHQYFFFFLNSENSNNVSVTFKFKCLLIFHL